VRDSVFPSLLTTAVRTRRESHRGKAFMASTIEISNPHVLSKFGLAEDKVLSEDPGLLDVRLVYSDRLHERGATSSANISVE